MRIADLTELNARAEGELLEALRKLRALGATIEEIIELVTVFVSQIEEEIE